MKRLWKRGLQFFLLAVAAELFLFNFRSWEAYTFPKAHEESYLISYDSGGELENGRLSFSANQKGSIIIENINEKIENLYLNVRSIENPDKTIRVILSARDEGSSQYYEMPYLDINPGKESSKYIRLNVSGEAKSLKITFQNLNGDSLWLSDIHFNVARPFEISVFRVLIVWGTLFFFYVIRPSSPIYGEIYSLKKKGQRACLLLITAFLLTAVIFIGSSNPNHTNPRWIHHYQYQKLAESFSRGHLYLEDEPSEALKAMENPYDTKQRKADKVPYIWDQAYYNGKYYCYFGVLPVFVYYLPCYLLTGSGFPTFAGVLCNLCALIIGVFFLLDAFVKRYFPKASFGLFSLLYLFLVLGSGTFLMAVTPTFYNMPISMGAALSVWGLYFWMRASEEEKLKKGWLFAGAVFMAAVAACRPQFLVFSLLAAVLFGGRLIKQFKKGRQGMREGIKSSLCIFVPFIIIGGLLMYYNKARFGSAFDFGANYNLTTNDMTSRGFHLDRLPFGLFMYLLQPPEIGGRFPFLFASRMSPSYQGITIYEAMYGGFLWYYPICAVFVFVGQIKRRLKEKGLWGFCLLSAALGVLVVCADIQMAGILQRYWSDFGLLFLLPAGVFAMALEERASENGAWKTVFGKGLFWTAAGTMLINGLWLLAHG